ncbi:MAG: hypothetical protein HY740_09115 [Chloroflexi bacterium]|nr:hypothetical protein [Chloroflexota bacterium]
MEVKLDKALYREVYQSFKRLNDLDMRPHADKLNGWTQFVDLWEFGWQMGIKQSPQQQAQKMDEWNRYYANIQKLETWRQRNGRAS